MIRRPPRSTLSSSSAASDVYKRQPRARWPPDPIRPERSTQPWIPWRAIRMPTTGHRCPQPTLLPGKVADRTPDRFPSPYFLPALVLSVPLCYPEQRTERSPVVKRDRKVNGMQTLGLDQAFPPRGSGSWPTASCTASTTPTTPKLPAPRSTRSSGSSRSWRRDDRCDLRPGAHRCEPGPVAADDLAVAPGFEPAEPRRRRHPSGDAPDDHHTPRPIRCPALRRRPRCAHFCLPAVIDERDAQRRRLAGASSVRHWQRSAGGTSRNTCSTWAPQPFHDGRPHFRHVTPLHIPHRVSLRRRLPRCAGDGPLRLGARNTASHLAERARHGRGRRDEMLYPPAPRHARMDRCPSESSSSAAAPEAP